MKRFTYDEHQETSQELYRIRNYLTELAVKVGSRYGKNSKAARRARAALDRVDQLRCELDNRVCGENPMMTNHEVVSVYY